MHVVRIYEWSEEQSSDALPVFVCSDSTALLSPVEDATNVPVVAGPHRSQSSTVPSLLRVSGDSMINAGIRDGDLIVVDQSLDPDHGRIAVVIIHGQYLVKRLHYTDDRLLLLSENPDYLPIEVTVNELNSRYHVWGIVTNVIPLVNC